LHLALTHGSWTPNDEVLVRVHEPLSVMDLLAAAHCARSCQLTRPLAVQQQAERGAALLLNCGEDVAALVGQLKPHDERAERQRGQMDLRTYGVGAQILRELGISKMKLLGSPRRMPSMAGYGLNVTGFIEPSAA